MQNCQFILLILDSSDGNQESVDKTRKINVEIRYKSSVNSVGPRSKEYLYLLEGDIYTRMKQWASARTAYSRVLALAGDMRTYANRASAFKGCICSIRQNIIIPPRLTPTCPMTGLKTAYSTGNISVLRRFTGLSQRWKNS